ncbi:MAG: acetyl-CoA carboxylase biotin carboxyl carrier protein [Planctomycetota bacterium]|jgi:acetyl-CoA carboxylase biotin carboxyl carrier protein
MAAKKDKDKGKEKDKHLQRIKQLIDIMRDNDLVELEIEHGEEKISLKRSQPPAITAVPMVAPTVPTAPANSNTGQISETQAELTASETRPEELAEMKSPLVGTFYSAPSPDSEPYVEVGSVVDSTTIVCIIEAMKVMNEIKADVNGTIVEILVENGQAVEFGQVLFKVRPD